MQIGNCHLCGQRGELCESHIWPKFAYKQYVSDPKKGGQFFDLLKGEFTNAQYKRYWFCESCDGGFIGNQLESHIARLCKLLDADQTLPRPYDWHLLPFLVSISWRVAKRDLEDGRIQPTEKLRSAMKDWKDHLNYLRRTGTGKKPRYQPHSQHLFAVYPKSVHSHKMLGGAVWPDDGLVLSQVGPLFIVGILDRSRLSLRDLKSLDASEISPVSGTVQPVSMIPDDIPATLRHLFQEHQRWLIEKAVKAATRK
jgi:hypothetical protein